ncbi:Uncharacterized protein Fot_01405 [Forsythia ovata]|uniref:Uncharacterized protein n=1 Tax=Forsythia ovata TaxID=205694 RepID=A0ABD1X3V6_9LAMI
MNPSSFLSKEFGEGKIEYSMQEKSFFWGWRMYRLDQEQFMLLILCCVLNLSDNKFKQERTSSKEKDDGVLNLGLTHEFVFVEVMEVAAMASNFASTGWQSWLRPCFKAFKLFVCLFGISQEWYLNMNRNSMLFMNFLCGDFSF